MFRSIWFSLVGWTAFLSASDFLQAESRLLVGGDGSQLQSWVDQVTADKLRPVWIQAVAFQGQPRFSAVADSDPQVRGWSMRHNLTPAEFQTEFDRLAGDGYQLLCWTGYLREQQDQLAAIWVKHDQGGYWHALHQLSAVQFPKKQAEMLREGELPLQITHYATRSGDRYAGIFLTQPGLQQELCQGVTLREFKTKQADLAQRHFRPTCVSMLQSGRQVRASAIFVQDGLEGSVRWDLSEAEASALSTEATAQAMQPLGIVGYLDQGNLRYAVCLRKTTWPEPDPTGELPAQYAELDEAVRQFMRAQQIPCGALCLSHQGQILFSRGYGFARRDRSRQVQPHDLFRIASVSKPITAALIRKLAREGKIDLQAAAFPLIGVQPLPGQAVDPRLNQITIEQLLNHQGGWVRSQTFDPMFMTRQIARELGRPAPATAQDVFQYMLGKPLQFDPGSHTGAASERYSNFGYCVLGRVIEKATGKPYGEAIQELLFTPLEISEIRLGRTRPADRDPLEPFYSHPGVATSVFVVDREELVPWPDGGYSLEAMDAHGGLIASAPSLAKLFQHYWGNGEHREPDSGAQDWISIGSIDGTAAMVRQIGGYDYVILFNQRISTEANRELRGQLDAALKQLPPE